MDSQNPPDVANATNEADRLSVRTLAAWFVALAVASLAFAPYTNVTAGISEEDGSLVPISEAIAFRVIRIGSIDVEWFSLPPSVYPEPLPEGIRLLEDFRPGAERGLILTVTSDVKFHWVIWTFLELPVLLLLSYVAARRPRRSEAVPSVLENP